jgi:catecholate siderophore receptor
VVAVNAVAQDQIAQLETIHTEAAAEQSLKVDKSANSKFVAPLLDTPKSVSVISKQLIEDTQVTTLSDALRTVPGSHLVQVKVVTQMVTVHLSVVITLKVQCT